MKSNGFKAIIILIIYVWAGMVLGISFLEAPLKFQAPNITLTLGLGIGRLVFSALNKIEIFFCLSLLVLTFYTQKTKGLKIKLVFLAIILAFQTIWLLPALDERALAIMAEKITSGSSPHIYYVVAEAVKLVLLIVAGLKFYNQSENINLPKSEMV